MRLYFHLMSATGACYGDRTGVEVDEVEPALADAMRAVDGIGDEEPTATEDWSGWMLNITDASGRTLLLVELGRTIQ
jgi:hypothetical protein